MISCSHSQHSFKVRKTPCPRRRGGSADGGRVEVDETYVGEEEGVRGRQRRKKALVVVAAEEDGNGIGRIRMGRIQRATKTELHAFVKQSVEAGSTVHTDGWEGIGYRHEFTFLAGKEKSAAELLPRVHRVASLLKRWLVGTHQGAVSHKHLAYYLDEFTFRFNRRTPRHRGKLFFRLVQQAVAVPPRAYREMVQPARDPRTGQPQDMG